MPEIEKVVKAGYRVQIEDTMESVLVAPETWPSFLNGLSKWKTL